MDDCRSNILKSAASSHFLCRDIAADDIISVVGNDHGNVCLTQFEGDHTEHTLTSWDLVMSRTCLSLSASVISFSVESIPRESNTNMQGHALLQVSLSIDPPHFSFATEVFNSHDIDHHKSIQVNTTICEKRLVNSASVSKYRQYPSGLESKKFLTTARLKKVFPVLDLATIQ